jgi:ribulose-phosphate 3-epimerase
MAILSPSILAADVLNLERDIRATERAGVKWLHVDVMDGSFVPNLSFGYSVVGALRKITDLVLDVHLMIRDPLRYVEDFCKAGADYLTIHVEADTPENIDATLEKIASLGVKPGIVLKPGTDVEAIKPYLTKVSLVLVMTVEPGFGGQAFMEDMMPKLQQIRTYIDVQNPACELEVDGGVNETTAKICTAHGANVLVAGSAYFKSQDPAAFSQAVKQI